jgi:hypothetical protein
MEIGAKGSRRFIRVLRLSGIPEKETDITVVQKGVRSAAKKQVTIGWEA